MYGAKPAKGCVTPQIVTVFTPNIAAKCALPESIATITSKFAIICNSDFKFNSPARFVTVSYLFAIVVSSVTSFFPPPNK